MARRPKQDRPEGTHAAKSAVLHTHLTLIETDDPLLLAELRADARAGQYLVAQLDDRRAIVRPGSADPLIKQLLKAGHLPRVIEE